MVGYRERRSRIDWRRKSSNETGINGIRARVVRMGMIMKRRTLMLISTEIKCILFGCVVSP